MTLWLGITALLLLITSEFISPYYGKTCILIEKGRLRRVALVFSTLFFLEALIQIYAMLYAY
jgi:hypothetical protein